MMATMTTTQPAITVPAAVYTGLQAVLDAPGVTLLDLPAVLAWLRREGYTSTYDWCIKNPREFGRAMLYGFESE
jgi:hypothetical protein